MTPSEVTVDRDGPVATVTLRRPDVLNAQTPRLWDALREIPRRLTGEVRVVVVRGEGRAFSAGLDLSVAGALVAELGTLPDAEVAARIADAQAAFGWLRRPDLVTIAGVQGHAIGAGFQLALACDLRVLADDAQLAMAEVTAMPTASLASLDRSDASAWVPFLGGTKRLVELVGYARALELCATGRRLDAAEARELGLANLVVPAAELDAAVADLTAAVLAGDRDAVIEIKALLAGAAGRSYPEQARAEREAQARRLRDLADPGGPGE